MPDVQSSFFRHVCAAGGVVAGVGSAVVAGGGDGVDG
jgi:hypothetical protein